MNECTPDLLKHHWNRTNRIVLFVTHETHREWERAYIFAIWMYVHLRACWYVQWNFVTHQSRLKFAIGFLLRTCFAFVLVRVCKWLNSIHSLKRLHTVSNTYESNCTHFGMLIFVSVTLSSLCESFAFFCRKENEICVNFIGKCSRVRTLYSV